MNCNSDKMGSVTGEGFRGCLCVSELYLAQLEKKTKKQFAVQL